MWAYSCDKVLFCLLFKTYNEEFSVVICIYNFYLQNLCISWLLPCLVFKLVLGDILPFQCPYKTPKDSPKPSVTGIGGGGLLPTLYKNGDLDKNTSDVYSQYRASLALVPCDAQAISVFTKPFIHGDYTISAIYVYDKPVEDLQAWLE